MEDDRLTCKNYNLVLVSHVVRLRLIGIRDQEQQHLYSMYTGFEFRFTAVFLMTYHQVKDRHITHILMMSEPISTHITVVYIYIADTVTSSL